ncbi:nucleotidyl transferase AbiEii/AbiGii toxin family protein [Ectothiorhodospira shaposhnikovii]|uniref:nucleotidyl transferase AbiEii/AbiGii toxin family protein n=1 Tax=Ectothiorhodospira shaposhnikovii TaxID=1054 RepID=UPI001EE80A6D|nr:nucleotidyl transferase AbiEii/AbiGii toxin family protein [Ectothiorhodospira shaposhnikovii]MCG5513630.1 nucleotidyl transferase AbiEii/AbiGii toxin family protein [Ectothiorhodospira shaposhnikovii]
MNQRNIAASVRARLLNRARETRQDFNLVLTRYALERLLYRLSVSPHADQFLLKGALLFDLWFDIPHRPTRDARWRPMGPDTTCCFPPLIADHRPIRSELFPR